MEQLSLFADNGYIKPCPFISDCLNYPIGCGGLSWWCNRIPKEKEKENFLKRERTIKESELKEKLYTQDDLNNAINKAIRDMTEVLERKQKELEAIKNESLH